MLLQKPSGFLFLSCCINGLAAAPMVRSATPARRVLFLFFLLASPAALAQQTVQPLPKVGSCPLGYYSSGSYCVPSRSGNARGALEKSGGSCPLGFYTSGSYCVSSPSNNRQEIGRAHV